MNRAAQWSYVQARLQARHGERLKEPDWRALEAARSLEEFVARAGVSSLRRFTARVHAGMSSHAVERLLRENWRGYVAELADWVPAAWRPAVLWTALVPELPIIDGLRKGETPNWIKHDPAFAELAAVDRQHRHAAAANSPRHALIAALGPDRTLAASWYSHWRSLWPRRRTDRIALIDIAAAVSAHVEQLDRAGPQQTSASYRHRLQDKLTRMFRRHSGTSAAVFCHLALVALDLERLRGGLMRRRLFERSLAEAAA